MFFRWVCGWTIYKSIIINDLQNDSPQTPGKLCPDDTWGLEHTGFYVAHRELVTNWSVPNLVRIGRVGTKCFVSDWLLCCYRVEGAEPHGQGTEKRKSQPRKAGLFSRTGVRNFERVHQRLQSRDRVCNQSFHSYSRTSTLHAKTTWPFVAEYKSIKREYPPYPYPTWWSIYSNPDLVRFNSVEWFLSVDSSVRYL